MTDSKWLSPKKPKFRILQLTDTHFGHPNDNNRHQDVRSQALIRELVATHRPDYIFHTGDFINNDVEHPEFGAIAFMESLGVAWSVIFGNHDHPNGKARQKSLDDYYATLANSTVGFITSNGHREYGYRVDLRIDNGQPFATLMALNTGNPASGMKVSEVQSKWWGSHGQGPDCRHPDPNSGNATHSHN